MIPAEKPVADFFFTDETTGEKFDLYGAVVVGRNQGDFQFPNDPRMSSKHAMFSVVNGEVLVEDLGSRNGVVVNSKRIEVGKPNRLLPGDIVEMGDHTFCIGRNANVPISPIRIREETHTTEVLPSRTTPQAARPPEPIAPAAVPAPAPDSTPIAAPVTTSTKRKKVKLVPKFDAPEDPLESLQLEAVATPEVELESAPVMEATQPLIFALLTVFGATFLFMTALGVHPVTPFFVDVVRWGANHGPETTKGEWWRLLTSAFIHAGLVQLIASCFASWQILRALGQTLAVEGALVIFLGSHALSSIVFVALQPDAAGFGAMPGILGLFGALAMALLRNRMAIDPRLWPTLGAAMAILLTSNLGASLRDILDAPSLMVAVAAGAALEFIAAPSDGVSGLHHRFARPLAAAMVALILAWITFGLVPPADDPSITVRQTIEKIMPLAERYDRMRARSKAGQASALEVSRILIMDLLPALRTLKKDLQETSGFNDSRQEALNHLKAAFEAWERAWTLQSNALPHNDAFRLNEAQEFEAAAFSHFEAAARILEKWKMRPAR